jgi:EAL domain-containing protein (putative c-di-GMP-specific phosphodiesterase class I)
VETPGELEQLRSMGVELFQGYLLAKPALEALPEPDLRYV